jgi:hypothetical protein
MTAFLVHGNPDSARLWSRTIEQLGDYDGEIVAADLPGFAAAAPAGFTQTKEAYVDWIAAQRSAAASIWSVTTGARCSFSGSPRPGPTWSAASPAAAPRSTAPTPGIRWPRSGRPPARASATWRRS